jgi:protein TonB
VFFGLDLYAQDLKPDCDNKLIYTDPQILPEFPGGIDKLEKFIQENLEYPTCIDSIQGTVFVQFTVDRQGKLYNIQIRKGLGHPFDDAAIAVVRKMPDWIPAKYGNTAFCQNIVIRVKFKFE